jgi:phosphomannomutase
MHGVSHEIMVEAFKYFGFKPFVAVEAQQAPDPDFPTVKFPNPEESGKRLTRITIKYVRLTWPLYRRIGICHLNF